MNEIERLQKQINEVRKLAQSAYMIESGTAIVDYYSTSTVTGWSSFTSEILICTRIGKLVFVRFNLSGTSNDTVATFTMPHAASGAAHNIIRSRDNTGSYVAGFIVAANSSTTITAYPDLALSAWTASGTKTIQGELIYITA